MLLLAPNLGFYMAATRRGDPETEHPVGSSSIPPESSSNFSSWHSTWGTLAYPSFPIGLYTSPLPPTPYAPHQMHPTISKKTQDRMWQGWDLNPCLSGCKGVVRCRGH